MLGFKHAFRGLKLMLRSERNFKTQLFLFIILISTAFYFSISLVEWSIILTLSALVFSLETINSAIEKTCNLYTQEYNSKIKDIKDISATAVLIASLFSIVVATIIFFPYIFN